VTSPHKLHKRSKNSVANVDLALRLREWGENYGLEEDPYLEGLSDAIEKGKNLAVWASNDVMTLLPEPNIDSTEGAIYSGLVLIRNVLVFVPVALTWLAVGKATTAFSIYTATNGAASVVNFLQFWQNGYHILAKEWTLSHIAQADFYIIAAVIVLTFFTPFMNRSAVKRAARFEHEARCERLALVIEVESFLFDKRTITPLTMDSALINSLQQVVEATRYLRQASKRIANGSNSIGMQNAVWGDARDNKKIERFEAERKFQKHGPGQIEDAANDLERVSKRVAIIIQTLPRGAHTRKELKKIEVELGETRSGLVSLQTKFYPSREVFSPSIEVE
jgi:hypothetical protein